MNPRAAGRSSRFRKTEVDEAMEKKQTKVGHLRKREELQQLHNRARRYAASSEPEHSNSFYYAVVSTALYLANTIRASRRISPALVSSSFISCPLTLSQLPSLLLKEECALKNSVSGLIL